MAQSNLTQLSPEIQAMIMDGIFNYPVTRPCSNNLCCLTNYSIRPRPNTTTSNLLSTNQQMRREVMAYHFYKFDIYFINGLVAACVGYQTPHIYLHSLPISPSNRGVFTELRELWIVAGRYQFQELNTIAPYLTNLRLINLEHDMTHERVSTTPFFVVDYCNSGSQYHYPSLPARAMLVVRSKMVLIGHQLATIGNAPIGGRDLRWFLTRRDARPVAGVQIIVHLRCPMRLCVTCQGGGNSSLFRIFDKKMTIRYCFDSRQVFSVGWVEMK